MGVGGWVRLQLRTNRQQVAMLVSTNRRGRETSVNRMFCADYCDDICAMWVYVMCVACMMGVSAYRTCTFSVCGVCSVCMHPVCSVAYGACVRCVTCVCHVCHAALV